jgi:predicted TPR repeat methyltransferase
MPLSVYSAPARISNAVILTYEQYASNYDEIARMKGYEGPKHLAANLTPYLPKDLHILDIGVGTGLSSEPFDPMAESITGIDFSANMLAECRKKHPSWKLVRTSIDQFEPEQSYSLIIADCVIKHLPHLECLATLLARASQTNTVAAITAHDQLTSLEHYHDLNGFSKELGQYGFMHIGHGTYPLNNKGRNGQVFIFKKN